MSNHPSPSGYSIFDFMTRVVPGLIVMIPFALGYLLTDAEYDISINVAILVIIIFGFITGEFINLVSQGIRQVPPPFKRVAYHDIDDGSVLGYSDRFELWVKNRLPNNVRSKFSIGKYGRCTVFDSTDIDFKDTIEEHFGLDFNDDSIQLIYNTFFAYMDSRMSKRTRRNYIVYVFSQNLMVASILTILSAVLVVLLSRDQSIILAATIISFPLLFLVIEISILFSVSSQPFVDYLIMDYYIDVIED